MKGVVDFKSLAQYIKTTYTYDSDFKIFTTSHMPMILLYCDERLSGPHLERYQTCTYRLIRTNDIFTNWLDTQFFIGRIGSHPDACFRTYFTYWRTGDTEQYEYCLDGLHVITERFAATYGH